MNDKPQTAIGAADPSMEDILASIRRILSEDEGNAAGAGEQAEDDDVLVLDSAMMVPPGPRLISSEPASPLPVLPAALPALVPPSPASSMPVFGASDAEPDPAPAAATPEAASVAPDVDAPIVEAPVAHADPEPPVPEPVSWRPVAPEPPVAPPPAALQASPVPEPVVPEPVVPEPIAPAIDPPAAAKPATPPAQAASPPNPEPVMQTSSAALLDDHESLVAPEAAAAAASSMGSLMRTLTSERAAMVSRSGPTLEDLVREEMRPLLKQWLDTHLPATVDRLVRAEIERVVNRAV